MFDKLVESTKEKQGRGAGGYLAATTLIYGLALVGIAIGTIIGFSPALAEEYSLKAILAPPPLPIGLPPPPAIRRTVLEPQTISFTAPTNPIDISRMRRAEDLPPVRIGNSRPVVVGAPLGNGSGDPNGVWGAPRTGDATVPPPPPIRRDPPQTPEIKPLGTSKVSEGVLQGGAIRKVKPTFPAMALKIRAGGPVQVVVTISEDGRVTDATAVSGHPLLRSAAVEAARQWLFSPTKLSNVPVKVQGVLTFNFILE